MATVLTPLSWSIKMEKLSTASSITRYAQHGMRDLSQPFELELKFLSLSLSRAHRLIKESNVWM